MAKKNKILSPLRAIKQQCLDCCGSSIKEVRNCTAKDCSLYPYRFGKNLYRKKKILTEEQKKEISKILKGTKNEN